MQCQEVSQDANVLHIKFKFTHTVSSSWMESIKTSEYLCGALYTEFEFNSYRDGNTDYNRRYYNYALTVSVRFHKLLDNDDFTYVCKIESTANDLLVRNLRICDDHWHQIAFCKAENNQKLEYIFDITINSELSEGGQSIFVSLYDDAQSADFKLYGNGGSVLMHKTILAAHSPVLQSMLAGEWKETQEGSVALQGVSVDTLQHLKDYMYLNRLPETGLQELCVLASYYMMPRLAIQCCAKLLNYLTIDNTIELAEFASRYRMGPLYIAILKTLGAEKAKIDKLVSTYKINWVDICKKITSTE